MGIFLVLALQNCAAEGGSMWKGKGGAQATPPAAPVPFQL